MCNRQHVSSLRPRQGWGVRGRLSGSLIMLSVRAGSLPFLLADCREITSTFFFFYCKINSQIHRLCRQLKAVYSGDLHYTRLCLFMFSSKILIVFVLSLL